MLCGCFQTQVLSLCSVSWLQNRERNTRIIDRQSDCVFIGFAVVNLAIAIQVIPIRSIHTEEHGNIVGANVDCRYRLRAAITQCRSKCAALFKPNGTADNNIIINPEQCLINSCPQNLGISVQNQFTISGIDDVIVGRKIDYLSIGIG